MKKVISFVLTIFMALSMFSCLGVASYAVNGIESISFHSNEPIEIIENVDGQNKVFYNEETNTSEEIFFYDIKDCIRDSIITVKYIDGTEKEYEYHTDWGYSTWEEDGLFYRSYELSFRSVSSYSDRITANIECVQSADNKWGLGEHYFTLRFENQTTQIPVTIIETPVESLEYSMSYPVVYEEYDLSESYCEETDGICIYNNYYVQYNDVLTVNYKDGTSVVYKYDGYNRTFRDDEGNHIAVDSYETKRDVRFTSAHETHNWVGGNDYDITVSYLGKTTTIPIHVNENNVESFTYSMSGPIEIYENGCGYWSGDGSDSDDGSSESDEYFDYRGYADLIGNYIDKFTVNYKDGHSEDFIHSYGNVYYNADGSSFYFNVDDNQHEKHWLLGEENTFTIKAYGREVSVPIKVVPAPASIEFVPVNPIQYKEHATGYWNDEGEFIYNYDGGYEDEGTYYRWLGVEGSVIKVNFPDGTSKEYVSEAADGEVWNFYAEDGTVLSLYDNIDFYSDGKWTIGGDNSITLKYYLGNMYWESSAHVSTTIPVTIIDSPEHEVATLEIVEPTCSKSGYTLNCCEGCGSSFKTDVVLAKGHEFENSVCTICGAGESYESLHPYESETDETWVIKRPGASKISVTFSEDTYVEGECDWIYIYDGDDNQIRSYTSSELSGRKITVKSDVVKIRLVSNDNSQHYGFKVTDITAKYPEDSMINLDQQYEFEHDEEFTFTAPETGYYKFTSYVENDPYINVTCGDVQYSDDDGGESCNFELYVYINSGDTVDGVVRTWNESGSIVFDVTYVGTENPGDGGSSGGDSEIGNIIGDGIFEAEVITEQSCIITYGYMTDAEVTIPAQIQGYNVVGIDSYISESDVEILNLPETITSLSSDTFAWWNSLKEINVSEENPNYKSQNGIVYSYDLSEIIAVPNAFSGDVVIPLGTRDLTDAMVLALRNANNISVAEGHEYFAEEDGILYNADFTKIYFAKSLPQNYVMKESVTEVSPYAFAENSTVESAKLSPNVTNIAYAAFEGCSSLKSVEMPEGIISIDEAAFGNNASLEKIVFPSTMESIGDISFYGCSALEEIELNEGLNCIGYNAFAYTPVKSIVLPDSLCEMSGGVFWGCDALSQVYLNSTLKYISYGTFYGCTALKQIEIPANIEYIDTCAFDSSGLTSMNIPGTVNVIGSSAFSCCENLKTVTIADGVEGIDGAAFSWCESLTSITIPDSVTWIGNSAFLGCTSLEKLEIPNSVTELGKYTFRNCSKLTDIKLPENVTELTYHQFDGCESLEDFEIPSTLLKVDGFALDNTGWYNSQENGDLYFKHILYGYKDTANDNIAPENYTVNVDIGAKSIAYYAFQNQTGITSVKLPYTMEYIGDYAFYNCSSLKSIVIPAGVTHIGYGSLGYIEKMVYNEEWDYSYYATIIDPDFTIYGVPGSVAETYANENGLKFEESCAHSSTKWVTDKEATCKEVGSKHKECTACGYVLSIEEITKLEHTTSDWIVDKAATCKEAGSKHKECTACKDVLETEPITKLEHTSSDWIVDKAATCKEAGSKHKECTACKDVLETEEITKLEHTSSDWIVDKAATCTEVGSKHKECTACKEVLETEEITKLEHTSSDWIVDKAATCTEVGSKHKECTACKEVLETEEITKLEHTSSDWIVDKAATCTEVGSKHKECTECKEVLETAAIAKLDHTATDWVIDKNPTCFSEGSRFKYCTACGITLETEAIAKKAHTSSSWITDKKASASAAGSKHKECTKCGKVLETAKIAQLKCSKPKLKGIENTSSGVKITWGKVSGADKYYVYRKTSGGSYSKIGTTTKTYYTDKKAKSGKKYYYIVKAVNEAGSSSSSSSLSKLYLADPTLKTPKSTKKGITLTWSKVTGAEGYVIYYKTGSGSYKKLTTVKGSKKVTYTHTKAKKGKTYTYKVKAYKSKTYSAYSNAKKIKDKY